LPWIQQRSALRLNCRLHPGTSQRYRLPFSVGSQHEAGFRLPWIQQRSALRLNCRLHPGISIPSPVDPGIPGLAPVIRLAVGGPAFSANAYLPVLPRGQNCGRGSLCRADSSGILLSVVLARLLCLSRLGSPIQGLLVPGRFLGHPPFGGASPAPLFIPVRIPHTAAGFRKPRKP
jgi:hypothetical protein